MNIFKLIVFCISGTVLISNITVGGFYLGQSNLFNQADTINNENNEDCTDDFYFVHITDTHVRHRLFNPDESTKHRLITVLETITSFNEKPDIFNI